MKNKKVIIISIVLILIAAITFGVVYFLNNEDEKTTLSLLDKQWIENNKNNVVDLSIFTDVPTLSDNGTGLVFDFLNSLKNDTTITFNNIAYKIGNDAKTDYAFKQVEKQGENQLLLYRDNKVLITKNDITYSNLEEIKNIKIGVLKSEKDRIQKHLSVCSNITFIEYETQESMISKISDEKSEIDAIIVSRLVSLKDILGNDKYFVAYNLMDLTDDYVLNLGNNDKLNEIVTKYFKKWKDNNSQKLYNDYFANDLLTYLNIAEKEKSDFKAKRYTYGFVENAPYDLNVDGTLKGINKSILEDFSKMFNLEFIYKKYSSYSDLKKAFNNKEIDLFFDNYIDDTYEVDNSLLSSNYNEKAVVLTNKNITIDSIYSLIGEQVITLENSRLAKELEDIGINTKKYSSINKIISRAKLNDIIVIDNEIYNYYVSKSNIKFKNVYTYNMQSDYYYRVSNQDNSMFVKIFNNYLKTAHINSLTVSGYNDTINVKYVPIIIKYVLIVLAVLISMSLVTFIILKIKNSMGKKEKAFTKEDKLRYIDMLTSLKNRNYLNDNLEKWDNSGIYPQAIIIIDLNNIAYINDNYGHEEGDKIIGEAGNILIRNQMPNTDIIRTNGNEFLVYLVSYDEKQVVSYMKKLNKEFKELSHKFGAALGYSMITDGTKTVDDAINEATLDMRSNKEELNN